MEGVDYRNARLPQRAQDEAIPQMRSGDVDRVRFLLQDGVNDLPYCPEVQPFEGEARIAHSDGCVDFHAGQVAMSWVARRRDEDDLVSGLNHTVRVIGSVLVHPKSRRKKKVTDTH